MAASTLKLRSAPSGYAERGPGPGAAVALLLLFGALSGVGIALGEVQAMLASAALIAGIGALLDFRIGAVFLMVLLPVASVSFFPRGMFGFTGLNPINLLMAATLASFVLRGRQLSLLAPRPLLLLYVLPIVIAGLIGSRHVDEILPFFYESLLIHFTDAAGYLRDIVLKPLFIVICALLVGAALAQSKRPEGFLAPIVIAVWVMSLTAITLVVTSGVRLGVLASTGSREFFSTLGMHANDLGRLYAVAYALLLFTWGETRDKALKTLLVVTMGVLTIALILTFSRGAMMGFLMINGLFLLWKFNARTLAIALLVGALGLMLAPGAVWTRLTLGFAGGGDMNAVSAGRIDEIWGPLALFDLWKSPLWGSGLDSVMWANAAWNGSMLLVTHPHNAYLQAWLDMGLIGLVLLLAFFWHVAKGMLALGSNAYLSPTMRGFFQGAFAGLICFLVTGVAGSSLRPVAEFTFLWLAIGMMYGMRARVPDRPAAGATPPKP
jgi:O-antigen ligase